MNREETARLWIKCDEARVFAKREGKTDKQAIEVAASIWNKWANELIAERDQLKSHGLWKVRRGEWGSIEGESEVCRAWKMKAWADFSSVNFLSLGESDFPVIKKEPIVIQPLNIDIAFNNFIFPGGATFQYSAFGAPVHFDGSKFEGEVIADHAVFNNASFVKVIFDWGANFGFSEFHEWVTFHAAQFHERTRFSGACFHVVADFSRCLFPKAKEISFRRALFKQAVHFSSAQFRGGRADFRGISADHIFDMIDARFETVPWFNQANFLEAPDLDRVYYPIPGFFNLRKLKYRNTRQLGSRDFEHQSEREADVDATFGNLPDFAAYRAIRRLAVQGHDHEHESKAFKGEIRSKRFTNQRAWHLSFWFGIAYDVFSNFGRSALIPALWWIVITLTSFAFYLGQQPDVAAARKAMIEQGVPSFSATLQAFLAAWQSAQPCYNPGSSSKSIVDVEGTLGALLSPVREKTTAVNEAVQLAIRNAFVVFDTGSDSAHRSFGCLYGVELYGGNNPVAYVPIKVSLFATIQKIISVLFIFLFLLAVRNMLRVR